MRKINKVTCATTDEENTVECANESKEHVLAGSRRTDLDQCGESGGIGLFYLHIPVHTVNIVLLKTVSNFLVLISDRSVKRSK